ncbi:hypothetical protein Tco_0641759 [Tanacetum coccineum]
MSEVPLDRITEFETAQRQLEVVQLEASRERVGLVDRVRSLGRENLRVRALLCIEKDCVDSLRHHMALSQEEFHQVRRDRDDTRKRLRRIITARRVSTVRRIKTRERIKMKIVYQDYLQDKNSFKPAAKTTTNADGTSTTLIKGSKEELYEGKKFGGNEATKKTQKTLRKQMYENFSAPSTESLDSIFNRLQKIIIEQEVKGTASSSSSSNSHNMAFVSSPSSTNEVNTTYGVKETSSKAMVAIDGAGFDWSYMADDEVPTNMALMVFSDSEPKFEGYGPKTSKNVSEDTSNEVRESPDAPMVEKLVLDDKLEKKTVFPTVTKIEFVRPKQQERPVRKPVKYADMYSFDHVQANCNYHQRERVVSRNNYTRVNYNYSTKKAYPGAHRNMAPRAVLMKTGLRPLNTARPVNTAHPKTTVYSARPMSRFSKSAQSTVKRPYQIKTSLTNKNFSQKVNTAKGSFYTARPKAVNTVRPNSVVVNVVRANQVYPQKEDQGYVDSGCLRHMTGNMSYLSDFKEFDEGYVTFWVTEPKEENYRKKVLVHVTLARRRDLAKNYILMPLWKDGSLFDSSSKNASNDEPQLFSDARKKDDEGVIPTASLEATHVGFFGDDTEVDMSNITTTYPFPSTPNTRIHKDHSLARFLSQEEPKKVIQALKDPIWWNVLQERSKGNILKHNRKTALLQSQRCLITLIE